MPIHANFEFMNLRRDGERGTEGAKRHILGTEIQKIVFRLGGPARRPHVFESGAERPA